MTLAPNKEPLVVAVMTNYNGRRLLRESLASLLASLHRNLKVVLVDNGSRDGSVEYARAGFSGVEVLANRRNLLFCKATNQGIRRGLALGADYIFLINNDTSLPPECLPLLVEHLEANPGVAACQPEIRFMDAPGVVSSRGCCLSLSGRGWDLGAGLPAREDSGAAFPVLGVSAAGALYRASVLSRVGLLDESFGMYFEDLDLSLRLRQAGHQLHCLPRARLLHSFSATTEQRSPDLKYYYCEENCYRVVLNNFPPAKVLKSYALGIPTALLMAASNLRRGRPRRAAYILRGLGLGVFRLLGGWGRVVAENPSRARCGFWALVDERKIIPPRPRFLPKGRDRREEKRVGP